MLRALTAFLCVLFAASAYAKLDETAQATSPPIRPTPKRPFDATIDWDSKSSPAPTATASVNTTATAKPGKELTDTEVFGTPVPAASVSTATIQGKQDQPRTNPDIFDELARGKTEAKSTPEHPNASAFLDSAPQSLTPAEIARRAFPSFVVLVMQDVHGQPFCLGSGFFIEKDIVATNAHVVAEAAAGYAKLAGETKESPIKGVVAFDPVHDLALVQLESSSAPPLAVTPSPSANIGDAVYVIGNPRGFEATFSSGILSGFREFGSIRILQITAPISPGSSGGPVLDQTGRVIGVAAAKWTGGENLNFAIPASYVIDLQKQKTEPKPFRALPNTSSDDTLLGHAGGKHPREGVVGENLKWSTLGHFAFSLRNKLSEDVSNVHGFVILQNPEGDPVDNVPIDYEGAIPAHSVKRITSDINSDAYELWAGFYRWDNKSHAWRKISTTEWLELPRSAKGQSREGKVEFRILDFTIQ
jgi:S1-C subfamily serine protease